ncbi:MAG: threonine--tRNA ligase [archaeon]
MKLISLHCDYIKFKPLKKALKSAEEVDKKEKKVEECLVILTAVEKGDTEKITDLYIKEIKDIASQVKAKNIVLYPYAHLSSNLANPEVAVKIMIDAEKKLKKDFSVERAPFGYYKEFELKCKGHPLSELSREITSGGKIEDVKCDTKQLLREISKAKLDTSKLKENDHRILGKKLDLFSFHDSAPGAVFWHNNGLIIYNELVNYWREEHRKTGYEEISTPLILDKKLWQISGHWEKYKENIFITNYEKRDFAIKPMNCPGGMLIFKSSPKSYRDFPMKVAELGTVHRQELSGTLGGLFRVIKITQDDAHIYSANEKQVKEEIEKVMDLTLKIYKKFKINIDHIELSTRPEKRIGSDAIWDLAEKTLETVLKKKNVKYKINKGDGAFYGPKIDYHIKDSLSRTWQLGTIQLDFAMPERFDLTYTGEDGKEHHPIMLHRTIYGALERFIGILLEHTNGNLPTWLSPIQARVISFTSRNEKVCKDVIKKLQDSGIRADLDIEDKTVGNKVREAEIQRIPYILVLGDKEEKSKKLAVRKRGEKKIALVKLESFVKDIKKEIEDRV